MKLRTAKKIMRSKKSAPPYKLIAVDRGVLVLYTPRHKDLRRRAQARLGKYFWKYLLRKSKSSVRKAEKPDGYLLGIPFYKGCRPPLHPIPKDVPVHKFEFTYKDHYFWSSPKNQVKLK